MRIAILVRSLIASGGTERQAICLANQLIEIGHTVLIATVAYDKDGCFPDLSKTLPILDLKADPEDEGAPRRLANLLPSDLDILNPHDLYGARISYWYQRDVKRVSSVLTLNDLSISQWSLFKDPAFGREKTTIIKSIIDYMRDVWGSFPYLRANGIIAVLDERIVDRVKDYTGKTVVVVRSGVDSDDFKFLPHSLALPKNIRLLCHGIFYIHRRFEDIILALSMLREKGYDMTLTIIGDYGHKNSAKKYYEKLLDLTRDLGLEGKVIFEGKVSESALHQAYNKHDIFIFASHMQTWGLAVFEAMASGIPVVLSKSAGASQVLVDGKTALLVPPLSPQSIAEAVIKLIESRDLYHFIVNEARQFVEREVTWKKYADKMEQLFQMALSRLS